MWLPWVRLLSVALGDSLTASSDVLGSLVALQFGDCRGNSAVTRLWRCWPGKSPAPFGFETGLPSIPGKSGLLGPEGKDFLEP